MIGSLGFEIAAPLIGACMGSFAATVAVRARVGEAALVGGSRCDACNRGLGFADTVPIVSWVMRRGACAGCGARINLAHPVGEILGAVLGLSVVLVSASPLQVGLLSALGFALLTSALIDSQTLRLPDGLTLIIALAGAVLAVLRSSFDLTVGAVAALATFLLLEGVRRGFLHWRRKPGLGFGDVKLSAALALWLGLATSWAITLAAGLGLIAVMIVRPRDGRLPFGPWLALGGFVVGLGVEAGLWPSAA
jgi:leader peptidase (prepilin peptidase)/N-methyltransferase